MVDRTISNEFYIVQTKPQWYQLRLAFNKECIATAISLDDILEKLKTIAKRYETIEALQDAWRNTDFRPLSEITRERNEKEYKQHKDDYRVHIENIINDLSTVKLSKPKINKRLTPKRKLDIPKPEPIVEEVAPPVKTKISLKPRKVKKLIK